MIGRTTAAAELANLFNNRTAANLQKAAADLRDAMRNTSDRGRGTFRAREVHHGSALELDPTVDASTFAIFYFGVFPPSSAMVEGTMRAIREKLWVHTDTGGVARYENDTYHRIYEEEQHVQGNPWILSTLWLAEHVIAKATSSEGLQRALDLVRWARARATPSLILPEQVDPYGGEPLSVAPLTWSPHR